MIVIISIVVLCRLTSNGQSVMDTTLVEFNPYTSSTLMANSGVLTSLKINTTGIGVVVPKQQSIMLSQPSLLPTAFFCRMEHKLEGVSRIPVRFRLGDVDYTDAMEGKNRYDVSTFTPAQRQKD